MLVVDEVLGRLAVVVTDIDAQERHPGARVASYTRCSWLTSARHGPHHCPQTLMTTTFPGEVVQRDRVRRIRQVRPGQRARAAAAGGRVVEDVGFPAGRDEFEGAALRYRIATGTAASRPEQPIANVAKSAPAIASRRMVKRPPVGSTPRRPAGRRRRPGWSPRPARIPGAAGRARAAYRSGAAAASTPAVGG